MALRLTILLKTGLAVLCGLMLTATGLWAAGAEEEPAAAADKKYVTDPTTGKVVTAPEYGGTFTFAYGFEPAHADAYFHHGPPVVVNGGVVETLGIINWAIDRDEFAFGSMYEPTFAIPNLAESWDIAPDGLTYTFNIRTGVYWHDKPPMNGRELTAEDWVFNWNRMTGTGSGYTEPAPYYATFAPVLFPYESITAVDKYTVVIKLTDPEPAALMHFTAFWPIYPPEVIKEHGDVTDWRNLVGTGPYEMTDWVEGSSITYVKNPDYWGYDENTRRTACPTLTSWSLSSS